MWQLPKTNSALYTHDMLVRVLGTWFFMVALVGCTRRSREPKGGLERLSVRVADANGVRPGARVRLLALTATPCPCDETEGDGEAVNACACADSLRAQQKKYADGCDAIVLAETTSSSTGSWELPLLDGGTTLEAVVDGAGRWLRIDGLRNDIMLELEATIDSVVTIASHGAVVPPHVVAMYEDGRCKPFVKNGDVFVAHAIDREGVVLVEAPGLTPVQAEIAPSIEVDLRPPITLRDTCESRFEQLLPPYRVVWHSRYEHRTVQSDAQGVFEFKQVLQTPARVHRD